ncbi:LacI family DNA-binding transcriptional regulator [Actinospica durhamensis]|uniref:LacI family DNA-binding transcriptional regulator n=1 Tax=Actinospica durhamensis TaxID=1508375 RepID=A0A941EVD0_9ACTN|nr:LacI family DNA-binding transcriptional regulator [Actinospica durhamensis]
MQGKQGSGTTRRVGKWFSRGSRGTAQRTRRTGHPQRRRRAGRVTPGTASRALNGRGRLRQETRQRVQAAAERLNFQPDVPAQSLLSGRA